MIQNDNGNLFTVASTPCMPEKNTANICDLLDLCADISRVIRFCLSSCAVSLPEDPPSFFSALSKIGEQQERIILNANEALGDK